MAVLQARTEVDKHWTMTISSGVRDTARHKALHIFLQRFRGTVGLCRLCNMTSFFSTKDLRDRTLNLQKQRPIESRLRSRYHVSLHMSEMKSVLKKRQKTLKLNSKNMLNTVPSYMVVMWGWQSEDMISISLRIWTRSCSSFIFSFRIDFMAT